MTKGAADRGLQLRCHADNGTARLRGRNPAVSNMIAATPARRLAMTEDIVHGTFFLMDNRAVDGIDLEIDGGIQYV